MHDYPLPYMPYKLCHQATIIRLSLENNEIKTRVAYIRIECFRDLEPVFAACHRELTFSDPLF